MKLKIDKGIPFPIPRQAWEEVLNDMEIGDSVVISKNSYYSILRQAAKMGMSITRKATSKNEVRVWRTG